MHIYRSTILNLDRPNLNGRIYTKSALNNAFREKHFKDVNEKCLIPIYNHLQIFEDMNFQNFEDMNFQNIIGTGHTELNGTSIDVAFSTCKSIDWSNKFINPVFISDNLQEKDNIIEVKDAKLIAFSIDDTTSFPDKCNRIIIKEE